MPELDVLHGDMPEVTQSQSAAAMLDALYGILHRMIQTRPYYTSFDNLEFLVSQVATIMGAQSCTLRLLDRSTGQLVLRAQYGMSERYGSKPPLKIGEAVAGTVFEQVAPEAVEDLLRDRRYKYRTYALQEGVRSLICAPLVDERGPRGTLSVYFANPNIFTTEQVQFFTVLTNVLSIAVHCAELYLELTGHYVRTAEAFVRAMEEKHAYTRGHSERVAMYSELIADELGFPQQDRQILETAARLHDVGKLVVDLSLLDKATHLTQEDFELMKRHTVVGAEIVGPLPGFERHARAIRYHHERLDGKGYPEGLSGSEIDPITRIISVADAYDAMTSPRPYSPPYSHDQATRELRYGSGSQFFPQAVDALLQAVDRGPVTLEWRPAEVSGSTAPAEANVA